MGKWERQLRKIQGLIDLYWDNDLNSIEEDEGMGIYPVSYVKSLEEENILLSNELDRIKKQGDK